MADFALPTLVTAAAAFLARSGVPHLRHRAALRALLDRQGLLAPALRGSVAVGLGPVELALAAATGVALLGDTATVPVGGLLATVGTAFATFLVVLARTRPATPCGCGGVTEPDDEGVGPLDGLRAGVVIASGVALAAGGAARLNGIAAAEAATVLVAGMALAAVIDVAARVRPGSPATFAEAGP